MIWELVSLLTVLSAVVGFIMLSRKYLGLYRRRSFVLQYRHKYTEFINELSTQGTLNPTLYEWLLRKCPRVEIELGQQAYVTRKPPFSSTVIQNYAFLPNTLQQIKIDAAHPSEIEYVAIHLTHFLGIQDEALRQTLSKLVNPFLWVQTGIQYTLLLPIQIIMWAEIVSSQTAKKIERHPLVKLTTHVATILASLITIAVGWDDASKFIEELLDNIR